MKLAAPAPAEPTSEPATDAGFGDFGSEEPAAEEPAADDKPFDDEPFDAGVDADEDTDPKKFIEQLTGKLGQSLRKYTEEQGGPDFELEKFAINSLLSATHTSEMDEEDKKDIIKKVNTAGNDDSEDSDLGNNDDNTDSGNDGNDGSGNGFGDDTEPSNGNDEEGLEEYHIFENEDLFLANPKKNMIRIKTTKTLSIPHEISAKFCSSSVVLMPNRGRGMVCGSTIRDMLILGGIKDVTAKIHSGSKNKLNNAQATMKALSQIAHPHRSAVVLKDVEATPALGIPEVVETL